MIFHREHLESRVLHLSTPRSIMTHFSTLVSTIRVSSEVSSLFSEPWDMLRQRQLGTSPKWATSMSCTQDLWTLHSTPSLLLCVHLSVELFGHRTYLSRLIGWRLLQTPTTREYQARSTLTLTLSLPRQRPTPSEEMYISSAPMVRLVCKLKVSP